MTDKTPTDAQQYLNVASQCAATATSELAKNVLVDDGSGTLRELLNDAADAIRAGWGQPAQAQAQGVNAPNEWEDIRTLPTCDDLIWLYCQDSNTIDGPIAPEPNLEEYGWSHWAYANAPSTAWIDTAQAKQGERP